MTDQTSLYRHFDSNGRLLYVGISKNALARLGGHKSDKSWYGEIATVTIETFNSRAEALRCEAAAILNENPKYNIARPAKPKPVAVKKVFEAPSVKALDMVPHARRRFGYDAVEPQYIDASIHSMRVRGILPALIFIDIINDHEHSGEALLNLLRVVQHSDAEVLLPMPDKVPDNALEVLLVRGVKILTCTASGTSEYSWQKSPDVLGDSCGDR